MRKGIFGGETIYLTEKEWRESLKRFDLSKVVKTGGIYQIPGEGCYMCEKYRSVKGGCGGCPLDTKVNTCGDIMEDVVGGYFAFHADVNSGVDWIKKSNKRARSDVRKIHKALMSMETVKKRGG